jgi:hypothetical protein
MLTRGSPEKGDSAGRYFGGDGLRELQGGIISTQRRVAAEIQGLVKKSACLLLLCFICSLPAVSWGQQWAIRPGRAAGFGLLVAGQFLNEASPGGDSSYPYVFVDNHF